MSGHSGSLTVRSFAALCVLATAVHAGEGTGERPWRRDGDGRVLVTPPEVPPELRGTPWPAAWEEGFQARANHVIRGAARAGRYGTTYFESEKRSYGWAMLSVLGGFETEGLAYLQEEDHAATSWHKHTHGIDYFPCFTLKHQIRKYFFFGPFLAPEYRRRMFEGARCFTEKDPLHRPHHSYRDASGWTPEAKNSWVDVRSTDNLKLMRDTSVYLLAEETGNEETRRLYADHIRRFVTTLYHAGMGEWDSENYLGHSVAPLLNLHDFARDVQMKQLAKASLDWISVAAALKYWRGNFNGPTRRDYNHPYAFGGSAAAMFWLYFGDSPRPNEHFESDEIHIITSAYRPPAAAVHLARKSFPRPLELLAAKPPWAAWKSGPGVAPEFYETQYFGESFQLGTLLRGTQKPDVNGFKLLAYSSERGADQVVVAPIEDPLRVGSPRYGEGLAGPSSVAHCGHVVLYLTASSDAPYLVLLPEGAAVDMTNDVLLVRLERTWLAFHPAGLRWGGVDDELTAMARVERKRDGEVVPRRGWERVQVVRGDRVEDGLYGFALEVGEKATHESWEEFRRGALERARLTVPSAPGEAARFEASTGRRVELVFGKSPAEISVRCDGDARTLKERRATYRPAQDGEPIIAQEWESGTLRVEAGGASFRASVTREGEVTFEETGQ